MRWFRMLFFAAIAISPAFGQDRGEARKAAVEKLDLRIEETGWGNCRHADLSRVLKSSCSELAVQFNEDDLELEPIRVRRGESGPITHYKRTVRGEIMILLSSKDRFWCQHAYQMAHELCHVLCGFKKGDRTNLWFEESLCELASIYAVRAMARTWETAPPYPNWKDYSKALDDYANDLIEKYALPEDQSLDEWYEGNAETLSEKSTDRALNGIVAVQLLPILETNPEYWRAVRWLNHGRGDEKQSFREYLRNWHGNCPEELKPFVVETGKLLGVIE